MRDAKSPQERILEVLVFAPAGLALTAVEEFPKLAEKGRHRIEGQVHTARLVGQFAVQMGRSQIEQLVRQIVPAAPAGPAGAESHREPGPVDGTGENQPEGPTRTPSPNGAGPARDLAIPGYDTLSASQVVQRLGGLSPDELEEVRAHELGHRHRRTILNRVDQLLAESGAAPPQ